MAWTHSGEVQQRIATNPAVRVRFNPPGRHYFQPLNSSTAWMGAQVETVAGDAVTLRVAQGETDAVGEVWATTMSAIGWTVIVGDAVLLQVNRRPAT